MNIGEIILHLAGSMRDRQSVVEQPLLRVNLSTPNGVSLKDFIRKHMSADSEIDWKRLHITENSNVEEISVQELLSRLTYIGELEAAATHKDNEILIVLMYKLILTETFYQYLMQDNVAKVDDVQSVVKPTSLLKKISFAILLILGHIQTLAGTFAFSEPVWQTILGATSPVVIPLSILLGICNAVLFYSFEVQALKDVIGIDYKVSNIKSFTDIYEAQIDVVTKINSQIFDVNYLNRVSISRFKNLTNVSRLLNHDLQLKKQRMVHYDEPQYKKVIRYSLTAVGAGIAAGAGYYIGTSLLTLTAASLLGTPVGWAIIGGFCLTSLTYFGFLRGNSMRSLLNPKINQIKSLKDKFEKFRYRDNGDFDKAVLHKLQSDVSIYSLDKLRVNVREISNKVSDEVSPPHRVDQISSHPGQDDVSTDINRISLTRSL